MKKKILTLAFALILGGTSLFAFSPLIPKASAAAADSTICGNTPKGILQEGMILRPDPKTGLCLPMKASDVGKPDTVNTLLVRVINIILSISASLAILFVVIGGFKYITSNGNEEAASKGRQTLVNAIIGLVIIILAYTIVRIAVNTTSSGGTFGF
ncbi:MAG: Uncharacterized protein G01um101477_369 [Candidatus Doudnabacteria bacterium Gr01-1014_77]|uniref:Integral membrane protein n=1 Tax=Candidatus Doudnabacteria bacterium Gr01-1014_77 TaxID=2017133 RepID=A0A554JBH8_9BACT|nr:MAG: Uncharacterized protein G01um101477_369 [Candidatus Doudnabacteria bacterium Gr01-1014_77]